MRYFPASGLRRYATGSLDIAGISGIIWGASSAGVGNVRSTYLDSYSVGWLDPLHVSGRAYCFPVRCVQAFI